MTDFDYPAFLAARLDEQEDDLKTDGGRDVPEPYYLLMMADIATKQAILAEYQLLTEELRESSWDNHIRQGWKGHRGGLLVSIEHLCRPFADHPDYPKDI